MTRDRRGAIAGVAEAAAILDITRQHLWNLRRADDRFPDVVPGRTGGPVWWVDELWAYRRQREQDKLDEIDARLRLLTGQRDEALRANRGTRGVDRELAELRDKRAAVVGRIAELDSKRRDAAS